MPRLVVPLPTLTIDMEKTGLSTPVESPVSPLDVAEPSDDFSITYRRPDVAALIKAGIEGVPSNQRVLIMGCGPQTLTRTVRNATSECIRTEGPAIELHCEQFGW